MMVLNAVLKYLLLTTLACEARNIIRTFTFHVAVGEPKAEMFNVSLPDGDCSSVMCLSKAVTDAGVSSSKIHFVSCPTQKNGIKSLKIWVLEQVPQKKDESRVPKSKKEQVKSRKHDISKFGDSCKERSDCNYLKGECLEGRCSCVVGYSYNFTENECVTRCSEYGRLFSTYSHTGIEGYNTKSAPAANKNECLVKCRDEDSFVCISAEYGREGFFRRYVCRMSKTTWNDIPVEYRNLDDYNFVLHYRHCKEQDLVAQNTDDHFSAEVNF